LNLDCTAHCFNRTGEFNKQTVASGLNETTVMFRYFWINNVASVHAETTESAFLIQSHEPAVADDISNQDGSESAFHESHLDTEGSANFPKIP